MIASINFRTKSVSLLSIPRDLYIEYPKGGAGRINELYIRGIKDLGSANAMRYLEDKIKEITGENVDYYAVVDFSAFIRFIDILG
jgi:anionic cell wall polymer biosynthesis LytR-Cps2A-Psr (LCP) family protein